MSAACSWRNIHPEGDAQDGDGIRNGRKVAAIKQAHELVGNEWQYSVGWLFCSEGRVRRGGDLDAERGCVPMLLHSPRHRRAAVAGRGTSEGTQTRDG